MPDERLTSYPVFDFHTHCFPDAIAHRTIASLGEKAGIPAYHDGTRAGLAAFERDNHSAGYLVLPIATKPSQTRSILDFAAGLNGKGGALSLGSVHPADAEREMWLDRAVDMGLVGIKLHPEYQDFFVDDENTFDFYEAIFKRNLLLVLHAGGDLGYENPVHGDPERIALLCDRFPEGKIVAAHMGGFDRWERVRERLAGRKNLWLDCSYAAGVMPDEDFAALARLHGTERVLFGTDSPWRPYGATLAAVLRAGFSEAELRGILYGNAMELLVC